MVDSTKRDIISKEVFENLVQKAGINNETILIVYGDFKNWFAAFAFWIFKYYGYSDIRLMNGSRKKWFEEDRPFSMDIPTYTRGTFKATSPNKSIRVLMDYVKESIGSQTRGTG